MKNPPPVSEATVLDLEARFPDRCPNANASDREVWLAAGAAEVVRFLRHHFEEQTNPQQEDDDS